jgi:hypothetical protein
MGSLLFWTGILNDSSLINPLFYASIQPKAITVIKRFPAVFGGMGDWIGWGAGMALGKQFHAIISMILMVVF